MAFQTPLEELEAELKTARSGLLGLIHHCEECHTQVEKDIRDQLDFIALLEENIRIVKEANRGS